MEVSAYDRGIPYLVIGWVLTFLVLMAVVVRIYSRSLLTRSLGSDDFTIVIATVSLVLTTD